jgi:hypothetical protein
MTAVKPRDRLRPRSASTYEDGVSKNLKIERYIFITGEAYRGGQWQTGNQTNGQRGPTGDVPLQE